MIPARGYAAPEAKAPLIPFAFERRDPRDNDVVIDILYCGVCHSDLHQVKDEWGGSTFPMVPGHEIVGRVSRIGKKVSKFKPGDTAGVGCMVGSCKKCDACKKDLEQFCSDIIWTYNSPEKGMKTPTYGGYSSQIVIQEDFVLKIPPKLPLERVAPLLCAGITTYSPLHRFCVRNESRVGILGLGGLGHMAVKLAVSLGAEVTMLSSSPSKAADAKRLGAHHFILTSDAAAMKPLKETFDLILDTVSAPHDLNSILELIKAEGTLALVGVPPEPASVEAFHLIGRGRTLAGSLIGGIRETQEMLDYCASKNVLSDVEVIPMAKINEAYERMLKGDVRYRFVIDMKTLSS